MASFSFFGCVVGALLIWGTVFWAHRIHAIASGRRRIASLSRSRQSGVTKGSSAIEPQTVYRTLLRATGLSPE